MVLTLMCGLPRSGKTTYSSALSEQTGVRCIHRDEEIAKIIHTLPDHTPESLEALTDQVIDMVADELSKGNDVIYDSCNHTAERRAEVIERCMTDGLAIRCIYMATPNEICFERDRDYGWSRIMAHDIQIPTESEGFDEVIISYDGYETEEN